MSVADEITRLQSAKSAIASAIADKGVTVPAATKLDGYPALIGQISTGITPSGTKAITANGTYDVASFASASVSVIPRLQSKTANPSTVNAVVRPGAGYDGLSAVTVNKVTSAIDANITAGNIKKGVTILGVTGTLEGGGASPLGSLAKSIIFDLEDASVTEVTAPNFLYMNSNFRTISFPNCSRITGSYMTYNNNALSSVYLDTCTSITGSGFLSNCSNLTTFSAPMLTTVPTVLSNHSKVSNLTLTAATSLSSYAFATFAISSVSLPNLLTVGSYAFTNCQRLPYLDLPNVTTISSTAFYYCTTLSSVSMPKVTVLQGGTFQQCSALKSFVHNSITSVGSRCFVSCYALSIVSLPKTSVIGSGAFSYCSALTSVYLTSTSKVSFMDTYAFWGTPCSGTGSGKIYVPSSLISAYTADTNLSRYSSHFVAI